MRATQDFSPVAPDEAVNLSFDFSAYLASGDSITSVVAWNCTVAPESLGSDPDPAGRLSGSPIQSGSVVTQKVDGCIANVVYVMEAVVGTAAGEELSLWALCPCVAVGQD